MKLVDSYSLGMCVCVCVCTTWACACACRGEQNQMHMLSVCGFAEFFCVEGWVGLMGVYIS